MRSIANSVTARDRAAVLRRVASPGSLRTLTSAAARAFASPGGTSRPDRPCSTRVGVPPAVVATIGRPVALPSRPPFADAPLADGGTNTLQRRQGFSRTVL